MSEATIYELAVIGRAKWDLHSLNNEGSIGNVTEPRTVMLADGTKSDGVSGEMLKHIHVHTLWQIAQGDLPLCSNCRHLEPNKANKADHLKDGDPPEEAMQASISQCALCDLHGFLVEKPTINRSSCIEFGWAVGLPGRNHRDLHLHARHAVGDRAKPKAKQSAPAKKDASNQQASGDQVAEDQAGTSQMVYHRPTRSGEYAVVSVFKPWYIGLEHFDYTYVIDHEERCQRFRAAMRAYQAMFWQPDGAMTTTRLPHVEGFEGAVVVSRSNLPVPVVSALGTDPDYREELADLVATIGGQLEVHTYDSMAGFVKVMDTLANDGEPFTLSKGA